MKRLTFTKVFFHAKTINPMKPRIRSKTGAGEFEVLYYDKTRLCADNRPIGGFFTSKSFAVRFLTVAARSFRRVYANVQRR